MARTTTDSPVRALARALAPLGSRGIALAVSGGSDSMALLAAAAEAARRDERLARAVVIHVDHGLRARSAADADLVRRQSEALGFRARIIRIDSERPRRGSLEAWARARRYAAAAAAMGELGLDVLVTAHHRDDQAETVALALMRGAAGPALGGMPRLRPLAGGEGLLVRPFLSFARDELSAFRRARGLAATEDESNRSLAHRRNLVRHLALAAEAPLATERLLELGRRAQDLDRRLARWAAARLLEGGPRIESAPWEARLDADAHDYDSLPVEARRALLRVLLLRLGRADVMPSPRALAALARGEPVAIARDCQALLAGDRLVVATTCSGRADERRPLRPGTTVALPRGGLLRISSGSALIERSPRRQWLPRRAVAGSLVLRALAPGERIRPFGMAGTKEARDLLRAAGVDARARRDFPVVADESGLLWLPGLRAAERCRVAEGEDAYLLELVD